MKGDADFGNGDAVQQQLQELNAEAKDVAAQLKDAWADWRNNPDDQVANELLQALQCRKVRLDEMCMALEAKLPDGAATGAGAAAGDARRLTEAVQAILKGQVEVVDYGDGEQLLRWPVGTRMPGDGRLKRRSLLVRACFSPLYDVLTTLKTSALVIGTPGIGKSWFFSYVIYRLLQLESPPTIVWQKGGRRFLIEKGVALLGGAEAFKIKLQERETWFLADSQAPAMGGVAARTILVSSPNRGHYKEFRNDAKAVVLYMPLWTEAELLRLHKRVYDDVAEDVVQKLMEHYGPVPRYVLEDPSIQQGRFRVGNALESLRRMVLQADIDQVARDVRVVDQHEMQWVPFDRHTLLHLEATEDFHLKGAKFASAQVKKWYIGRLLAAGSQQVGVLIHALTWRGLQPFVEHGFEALCHAELINSPSLQVQYLAGKQLRGKQGSVLQRGSGRGKAPYFLHLPRLTTSTFGEGGAAVTRIKDAAELVAEAVQQSEQLHLSDLYLKPAHANFPGIDALAPTQRVMFQITVSSNCNYYAGAMAELMKCLTKSRTERWILAYVVPSNQPFELQFPKDVTLPDNLTIVAVSINVDPFLGFSQASGGSLSAGSPGASHSHA